MRIFQNKQGYENQNSRIYLASYKIYPKLKNDFYEYNTHKKISFVDRNDKNNLCLNIFMRLYLLEISSVEFRICLNTPIIKVITLLENTKACEM
jgi:hypothetical protein